MHVAVLSVSDQLGGSEMALLEILRGVRAGRPDWTFEVILPGRGPLLERAAALGAACTVVEPPRALARISESVAVRNRWNLFTTLSLALRLFAVAAALPAYERRLRAVLDRSRPAVLHTNGLKAHIVGVRAARRRSPVVWHVHEYIGHRYVTRALLRRYVHAVAAVIANSASVAREVTSVLVPQHRVRVVHNGVDLDRFAPTGPRADLDALAGLSPAPAGTIRVGLVATFSRWKGHDVFLRAIAALPRDVAVRAFIVGDAVYDTVGSQYGRAELESLAGTLGVRVGFTGFIPSDTAMRALDIVVHASTEPEPFGLVIAEGMACGRAVITSGTGGAAELVTPGVDAVTHPPGDVHALADAIALLARNAPLRQQYGDRARAAAVRQFDSRRMAAAVLEVYQQAGASAASRTRV